MNWESGWPALVKQIDYSYILLELECGDRVTEAFDNPLQLFQQLLELEWYQLVTCISCQDLTETPIFIEMLKSYFGKSFLEVIEWYHQRQHRLWTQTKGV